VQIIEALRRNRLLDTVTGVTLPGLDFGDNVVTSEDWEDNTFTSPPF